MADYWMTCFLDKGEAQLDLNTYGWRVRYEQAQSILWSQRDDIREGLTA